MCYTSNERDYFSLSTDVFNSVDRCKSRKWHMKIRFFDFYFLVVHISADNVLYGLIFFTHVSNIPVEGTVSQIFVLGLSFYFMAKNG